MRELVEMIARELVDNPDEVEVSQFDEGDAIVLELRVGPDDLGKVIGKRGRTARAMRTLLAVSAEKLKRRHVLEIVD